MADRLRDPIWQDIARLLDSLPSTARIHYQRSGFTFRASWPRPGPERESVLVQLQKAIYSHTNPGQLSVRPEGWSSEQRYSFVWPAAVGLFDADAPEPDKGVVESTDSTGEKATKPISEIPGIRITAIGLTNPPTKANADCGRAILRMLYENQIRLTGEEITAELSRDPDAFSWSLSVVQKTCTWLHNLGAVNVKRDGKGNGFGLVSWETDPCGSD